MTEETGSPPPSRLSIRRLWLSIGVLSVGWLVLSGHYDLFHLSLGAGSVGLVLFLNRDLLMVSAQPVGALRLARLCLYALWLSKEMVLAAVQVSRTVLSPRLPISPGLVRFRTDQPNDFARVILGNSITLTPGTLTLEVEGNSFLVHHLTDATGEELVSGKMARRVAELFGPATGRAVYDIERV